jgi:predicted nucleotidyltransferase
MGVLKALESNREKINSFGVKKIGLFGSFLAGKQKKGSDLDFLVVFDKPTFRNYMGLKFFLEDLFHRKVDLVIEEDLKPALRYVREEAAYVKGL